MSKVVSRVLVLLLTTGALAMQAHAQTFPAKPLRLIVPFPAGGITDSMSRLIGEGMSSNLGQPVIIDNRAGAGGLIGLDALIKSEADGYTIGLLPSPTLISGLLGGREWKPDDEMTSLGLNYRQGILLAINPNAPLLSGVRNAADLVRVVKANPGKINYATIGIGSTGHLMGAIMASAAGLDWVHVPYKGTAPLLQDLLAAQAPLVQMGSSMADQEANPGRVLLIATTANKPESGVGPLSAGGFPGLDATTWGGFVGPARLPPAVFARLVIAYKAAFDRPDVNAKAGRFLQQEYMLPADMSRLTRETIALWGKVIRDNNIKP
jgi:tripartite-type tricarboxylate transporter receptor subunit TctC